MTEATAQQAGNKARTEFCAKHDSFADFCFVHHKTEPLVTVSKMENHGPIEEVFIIAGGCSDGHCFALTCSKQLVPTVRSIYVNDHSPVIG